MKVTVLFYGALWRSCYDFCLLCRRLALDFLDLLDDWNRVTVSRRYLGSKRMRMVLVHVGTPHHHRTTVKLVYESTIDCLFFEIRRICLIYRVAHVKPPI